MDIRLLALPTSLNSYTVPMKGYHVILFIKVGKKTDEKQEVDGFQLLDGWWVGVDGTSPNV